MLLFPKPVSSLFSPQKIGCALVALSAISNSQSFTSRSVFAATSTQHHHQARAMSSSSETCAAGLTIVRVPCLSDNYGWLIHDQATGSTAVVDTPEAKPYQEELSKRGWKLTHIINTHHHWDHTGANLELKGDGVKVVGPKNEKEKIPGIDDAVGAGDVIEFGSTKATVMDVRGHTKGHVAYYFPEEKSVFVGDSLFALGCGRMFEGTPDQFWTSLKGLRELPDDTTVYWYVYWGN
jgi:hydroxyacylglutathione hydrolase